MCETHGKQLVCPTIPWNCFVKDNPVKLWYAMLGPRNHAIITKEVGCWFNFQMKMREVRAKPISVTQREAEDRAKEANKTFLVYYFHKLRLLATAFPESLEATHISRIRAKFNDAQADRYIQEQESLRLFAAEIRQYNDHLKLHPPTTAGSAAPSSRGYRQFPYPLGSQPTAEATLTTSATKAIAPSKTSNTAYPSKPRLALPSTVQDNTQDSAKNNDYKKQNNIRIKTIQDRVNPGNNKPTRSFLRSDGNPKFIERPCEFCEKLGKKEQWHFGFVCSARNQVQTLWIETLKLNLDENLPGVTETSFTENPTSHVFAVEAGKA